VAKIFDISWKIAMLSFLWAIWWELDSQRSQLHDIRVSLRAGLVVLDPYGSVLDIKKINDFIYDPRELLVD
jgi:hypothetical protein